MARGGAFSIPPGPLQNHLTLRDAHPEEVPEILAHEAMISSGAAAVHIYLWHPTGDFLYGAGVAGTDDDRLTSLGFPLGDHLGFIFFRTDRVDRSHRADLGRIARRAGDYVAQGNKSYVAEVDGPEEATAAFMSALRAKSPSTAQHCARVARYSATAGLALGMTENGVCQVERCALLHDVGKLGVTDSVLEKPGDLTAAEWEQIRLHPEMGVRILKPCRSLEAILPAIAMHHERIDGTGYPLRVGGDAIPLEARIVNICDAYDTMTSDRPYRVALGVDEAMGRLQLGTGSQFDPRLVEVFTRDVIPRLSGGVVRTL